MPFTRTSGNDIGNTNGNGERLNYIASHDGCINDYVRCYSFNQFGHYASSFPDKNQGSQLIKYGIVFTQQEADRGKTLNHDWMVLEYCSTIILVSNYYLLRSVK